MSGRIYYTLFVKVPGRKWTPEFGDYVKNVVEQEWKDTKDDWPRGTIGSVRSSLDGQANIDEVCRVMNTET